MFRTAPDRSVLPDAGGPLRTFSHLLVLYDPAAYSRFLLAVPLLIVAEIVIGPRIAAATSQFITSGLVPKDHYPDFDAAIADGLRLRDSLVAEVIILVITYIGAFESLRIF